MPRRPPSSARAGVVGDELADAGDDGGGHVPDPPDDVVELATDLGPVAVLDDPAAVRHHATYVLSDGREDDGVLVAPRARGARGRGVEHDQVGALPDGDGAGVVPAERGVAVGGGGRQQLAGGPVAALLGRQPFVELEGAHLLEGIDHGVAVRPQRQPGTGVVQPSRRTDAVAEVALGGRAEGGVGTRSADDGDVVVGEVGGVHERRHRPDQAVVGEQPGGGDAVRLEARVVLGDLLGDVHVQRTVADPRRDRVEVGGGDRADRVHGRADADPIGG